MLTFTISVYLLALLLPTSSLSFPPFPSLPIAALHTHNACRTVRTVLLLLLPPSFGHRASGIENWESKTPKSDIGNRTSGIGNRAYRQSEIVNWKSEIGILRNRENTPPGAVPGTKAFGRDADRECARLRLELAALRQEAETSRAALELQVRVKMSMAVRLADLCQSPTTTLSVYYI